MENLTTIIVAAIPLAMLFFAKVLDNMLSTAKTIAIQRNKSVLAAILLIASNFLYYGVTKVVVSSTDNLSLIVVSVAGGVGCFLAVMINNRKSKDRLFIHILMNDHLEQIKEARDFIASQKIRNVAVKSFDREWNETISLLVFAETREQSKIIDKYLESTEGKFRRVIQKS